MDKRLGLAAVLVLTCMISLALDVETFASQPEPVALDAATQDKVAGSSSEKVSVDDLFGRRPRWFHPSLAVAMGHTDNIRNTSDGQLSDMFAVISPGFWLAVPTIDEEPDALDSSSLMPGGLIFPKASWEDVRRFQTSFFYGGEFERYSKYTEENYDVHRLEGILQFNFPGGLTMELLDQLKRSHVPRGSSLSAQLDEYISNLAQLGISYELGDRFKVRADLGAFSVDYLADRNDYLNREDSSAKLSLFYKFTPKTSLLTQYRFIDIAYNGSNLRDSHEQELSMGVNWKLTGKSECRALLGYGSKDFEDQANGDTKKRLTAEVQLSHRFSRGARLRLAGYRKTQETSIEQTDYSEVDQISFNYSQDFVYRVSGDLSVSYQKNKYAGVLTRGAITAERQDKILNLSPGLRVLLGDRIQSELTYQRLEGDSNFSDFSYRTNIVMLEIGVAL